MRRIVLLPLLFLTLPADARKKTPSQPLVQKVPSIEEVVMAEGFTPTPSQSDIYKPGSVLVPNGRGGHDVVVSGCIAAEPEIAIMSQSSIATTLSGGVSARLGVARGAASGSIEKRLSFVDPEQRTISLGKLATNVTDVCKTEVQSVAAFKDLSSAIVLYDVLVAIIKNSVCTKADASGGVVALGAVEAAAFSECVIESDGQVPLGYKSVPLDKVLTVADGAVAATSATHTPIKIGPVTERGEAEVEFGGDVDFAELAKRAAQAKAVRESKEEALAAEAARIAAEAARIAAEQKAATEALAAKQKAATEALAAERARLEEQERVATAALEAAQRKRIAVATQDLLAQAAADLRQIQPLLDMGLSDETRPVLQAYVDKWGSAKVRVDDLTEDVDVPGVAVVRRGLGPDGVSAGLEWGGLGPDGVSAGVEWARILGGTYQMGNNSGTKTEKPVHTVRVASFELMKSEVTVGQYRTCVEAGACSVPDGAAPGQSCNWGQSGREDHPINCVDWNQASAFAKWSGGRLPTEAEWEYAARNGGDAQTYPWGNEAASCSRAVLDDDGSGCGRERTWPVCSKPAGNSADDVCDLAGNVWEWTQDTWHDTYAGAPGFGTAWEGEDSIRVFRGGGWDDSASLLRSSFRDGIPPSYRLSFVGFRLAR